MSRASEILTKKKAPEVKGADKDDKQPMKKNSILDFIAKHKKPTK